MNAPIEIVPGKITHIKIYGEATGAIGLTVVKNASFPISVTWEGLSSFDLSAKMGLEVGTYRLTVKDASDRVAHYKYTINQNRELEILPGEVKNVAVYGEATGEIGKCSVIGGDGTYNPSWSSNATDITGFHDLRPKIGLKAGTYTLTVRDGVGASTSHTFEITQTDKLMIREGKVKNVPIMGMAAGQGGYISKNRITGGVLPYTFTWTESSGATDIPIQVPINRYDIDIVSTKFDLKPGTYTLTVKDAVGSSISHSFKVREGPNKLFFEFGSSHNFYHVSD